MKQKRLTFTARSNRHDASIAAHTPVETEQPAPACAPSDPTSAAFTPAPTLRLSWLNAERVLWIWAAIVAACVVWQPFLLGFYLDDWDLWVNGSTKGSPFSLTRLLFMNFTNPVRPGCLPGRFLGSSLFGPHPLLWQGALLLVNCAVAVSIVAAARALTQARTPAGRTITAAAGLCWLLLPWNAAARFWSALLPNTSMIAAQGFLCVLLVRGWAKNRPRPIAAGALYLTACSFHSLQAHAFGVDDDPLLSLPFPVPFSGWVVSVEIYWSTLAERRLAHDWRLTAPGSRYGAK